LNSNGMCMHRGRYISNIKDYDGGTMMETYVHQAIDYERLHDGSDVRGQVRDLDRGAKDGKRGIIKQQKHFLQRFARKLHEDRRGAANNEDIIYPPLCEMMDRWEEDRVKLQAIEAGEDAVSSSAVAADGRISPDACPAPDDSSSQAPVPPAASSSSSSSSAAAASSSSSAVLLANALAGGPKGKKRTANGEAVAHAIRLLTIPGVREAGWELGDILKFEAERAKKKDSVGAANSRSKRSTDGESEELAKTSVLNKELLSILKRTHDQRFAWAFREPVDLREAPGYLDVITDPIDLQTIEKRVKAGYYKTKKAFMADMAKIAQNCRLYNGKTSEWWRLAQEFDTFLKNNFSG
jgi:hypothetical protein